MEKSQPPNRIKSLRLSLGISQERLAELADLSTSYVSNLERGLRRLNATQIEKFAKIFDVSPGEILEAPPPAPIRLSNDRPEGREERARAMNGFGQRIAQMRERRNYITIRRCAQGIMSADLWEAMERGEFMPDVYDLTLISIKLGVTLSWLIRGIEEILEPD